MTQLSQSTLRPLLWGAGASFGALVSVGANQPALAQDGAAPLDPAPGGVVQLDTVVLTAGDDASPNTNDAETGIARLPGTVRETPKVVNVVPAEIIEQQNATTLQEALRNGAYFPWDYQPLQKASERYMRNHMDLNVLEENKRYPRGE